MSTDEARTRGRALVGATGFLGSTLLRQTDFGDLYDSRSIPSIRGRSFDLLVCAAPAGTKWYANRHPDADRRSVETLVDCLSTVHAARLILVSTVDVYARPIDVDEDSPVPVEELCAYGAHRRRLEQFVKERFSALVLRLPVVFGEGLKKNAIFDLLTGRLEFVEPDAVVQLYDVGDLWADIRTAERAGLDLLNLVSEPIPLREIARERFGIELGSGSGGVPPRYDVRTRHADRFGAVGAYLRDAATVHRKLAAFVSAERALD